jgi:DNA helicase II / ATP-dependent DNA helicase PcrA
MPPLTYNEFQGYVQAAVPRFAQNWLNPQQNNAVSAPPVPPVFIVAGPGTGKTTVLALRVLKHIFVDDYPPNSIIATTFTKKAASELRSRILSWGVATQQQALTQAQANGDQQTVQWLQNLDINQVQTGTLDALAQEMIANDRRPGEITPTVIESFMAKGLLRKNVMFTNGRHNSQVLQGHLGNFNQQFPGVQSFSNKLKVCHSFADRILHDGVDLNAYSTQSQGHQMLTDIINEYHNYLIDHHLMDFALLEQEILSRLQAGRLQATTQPLQALLVDEFQDTNYLQEQIYYRLCQNSGAALTVVGDDDQSIYRFRGATVEIFANFNNRLQANIGIQPYPVNLIENYRSSERIVKFFNHFISSDPTFQSARVPNKQACIASANWATAPNQNLPVLGMFRTNIQDLADDICTLLHDIFQGNGRIIAVAGGTQFSIQRNPNGDFGDSVLLAGKVQETKPDGQPRLPSLIRQRLMDAHGVDVFNPRGRGLAIIPEVMQCLGIMLECIDPNSTIQNSITSIKPETINTLNVWRNAGILFAQSNPEPNQTNINSLQQFINDWANRNAPNMSNWPSEWPLLELLFTVVTWFPIFQRSPEGQVYVETIARTIAEASQVSTYRSAILSGTAYDNNSVKDAIREIFEPIAEGEVEVDEEIMPYVPRAVFPIMTIHQAKGLEFPLVIVDVGSDFKTNHHTQRPFRYPQNSLDIHLTEDQIANHSPVGLARQQRTGVDRAFDDLTRQYFVAKSRPQNILLLVGLTSQLRQGNPVPSVATGDLRNGGRAYQFIPAQQWIPNSSANIIALI